ncbi:MAG: caspase family protein [Burkholderiaceae bacterium]
MNAHDKLRRAIDPAEPMSTSSPRPIQRLRVFVSMGAMALALASGPALAASRALLIGVSGYPSLSESQRLNGPKNDVVLIRRALESRGIAPQAIRTLADQVPGATLPTRAAILEALDRLARESSAGDFVFVYFAGHGSQSPVTPGDPHAPDEPDGLHEIFLPYDVGKWTEGRGAVENSILDHELVDRLQTMRRKGVFVWAVFDACHSATLMRSGDPDVRYRDVSPELLGVPQSRIDASVRAAQQRSKLASGKDQPATGARPIENSVSGGGDVAFYAAQTTERTPEERLPADALDRKPYGLFGWVLADAIGSVQGVSYRQLAHYVLHRYAAMNRLMPTPQFTGTHLDAPIFGTKTGNIVRQWRVDSRKGIEIRAGQVNQLATGHILALMASPTARTEEAIGYLRVTKADIASSLLEPIAHAGKPAIAAADIPRGAFARVFRPEVSFTLRVARPSDASLPQHAAVLEQISRIEREGVGTVAVRFVDAGAAHDIALRIDDGKLWLLPRGGLKREALRAGDAPGNAIRIMQAEFGQKLSDSLLRIGKALNLLRLADKASRTNAGSGLKVVAVSVIRNGHSVDIDSTSRPTLHSGDHVEVKVRNSGRVPVDLTALYLNSSYGIEPIFPADGADNRLHSGNETTVTVDIFDDTVGLERLMLIAVETRAMNQASDLTWLAQPTLDKLRTVDTETTEVFADAGFGLKADGPRTRSGSASRVPAKIGMTSLVFEVR